MFFGFEDNGRRVETEGIWSIYIIIIEHFRAFPVCGLIYGFGTAPGDSSEITKDHHNSLQH